MLSFLLRFSGIDKKIKQIEDKVNHPVLTKKQKNTVLLAKICLALGYIAIILQDSIRLGFVALDLPKYWSIILISLIILAWYSIFILKKNFKYQQI